jgi:F-type H+-transporting ATPase subunit gamma
MASVQDLRRRIRSVRNTRKITKAFELVASARLRRAQSRIEAMRPYADRMLELMIGTARAATSVHGLPLLQRRDEKTVAIVPLTGDRGLAGPFNSQILRHAFALDRSLRAEGKEVRWLVAGRKGASTLRFRGYQIDQSWTGFSDRPTYHDAQAIAHKLAELYVEQEIDRAIVVYNHFVSPLVQTVTEQDVLPIPEEMLHAGEYEEAEEKAVLGDFIYEPEPEEILARLLPFYLETELYRALLESAASEQGARMTAMRNASKNAGELIDSLTLAMNRARQAEITQEILEVVAGADALTA